MRLQVEMSCQCSMLLLEDPAGITGTTHPADDGNDTGWEPYWLGDRSATEMRFDYGGC